MKGRLDGIKQMQGLLREFPVRIQRDVVNGTARRGAGVVRKHGKKNLKANGNVETGKLVSSIRTKKKRGSHGVYQIFTDRTAPHAHLLEFGTGPRKLDKPTRFEIMPGQWITLKESGVMPASPFFRPAIDENQKEILGQMAQYAAKRMAKEATKMTAKYRTLSKTYRKKLAK